jgi:hypothetical protein
MLTARATAECARKTAADAILGIPYAAEELWDGEVIEGQAVTPAARVTSAEILGTTDTPPGATGAATETAGAGSPGPAAEAAPGGADTVRPTDARIRRMYGLLGKHGMGTRDAALAYINEALGRRAEDDNLITTSKDMSKEDTDTVIALLEKLPEPAPAKAAPKADTTP